MYIHQTRVSIRDISTVVITWSRYPNSYFVLIDSVRAMILVSQVDKIKNSSIDGLEQNVLYGNLKRAVALDFHYQKKLLFYTDVQEKKIYRTTVDGSTNAQVNFHPRFNGSGSGSQIRISLILIFFFQVHIVRWSVHAGRYCSRLDCRQYLLH